MRWQHVQDVDESGKSATFPHLKGLQNGDIATSRIKQVGGEGVQIEFADCTFGCHVPVYWTAQGATRF